MKLIWIKILFLFYDFLFSTVGCNSNLFKETFTNMNTNNNANLNSITLKNTATNAVTNSNTNSLKAANSITNTLTSTNSATNSNKNTLTATNTVSSSNTITLTFTNTATSTNKNTVTATNTLKNSNTASNTLKVTNTATNSNKNTVTSSISATNSVSNSLESSKHRKSHFHMRKLSKKKIKQIDAISPTAAKSGPFSSFDQNSDLLRNTNLLNLVEDPDLSLIDLNVGPGPIFFHGWVKYFKFNSDEMNIQRPNSFFKNLEFFDQQKKIPKANLMEKINGDYKFIHNEAYFYLLVFNDKVNFITTRLNKFQQTYDTLSIDLISPVVETKNFQGGITDFGAFSEGFCLKLLTSNFMLTSIPSSNIPLQTWILCTDTAQEKLNLMTILRKLKIKRQRDNGILVSSGEPPLPETVQNILTGSTPNLKTDEEKNLGVTFNHTTHKIVDGYWIVLQEWSQCSLKCGGGVSTMQRMCVPPKDGGKPCEGPAILTKPCNVQPCPKIKELKKIEQNNTITKKPIVKIMPFSDRPQRYTKCIIKESDLMLTRDLNEREKVEYVENLQIPVRVVMNNRTLSIFGSSTYDSVLKSFDLQSTTFAHSKKHKDCFILTEGNPSLDANSLKQAELCPFGFDRRDQIYQEWFYDFELFKNQCHSERDILDADEIKALDDKFKKKVDNARLDIIEERQRIIKEKVKPDNAKVMKTSQMALQAIQKELTLEEMIKREEEEKEQQAERELLKEIDTERDKKNCLVKAIKEKQLEDQYNLRLKAQDVEAQKIKEQAAKEIQIRRSQLKSAVLKMRKRAERNKAQLRAQLQAVRYSMANDMKNLYKIGDMNKCKEAMKSEQNKDSYCGVNFPDDFVKYTTCKTENEEFCYLCCETEFGDMHMDKRQICYDTICTSKTEDATGKWVWVDGERTVVTKPVNPSFMKTPGA